MTAQLLNRLEIPHASGARRIELFLGDLTAIPSHLRVDALVVSAFPNDYIPTPNSLIGALYRKGISVADLAVRKSVDLRATSSCWVSPELTAEQAELGFNRILCFEPWTRGSPETVVGDIFRALIPFLGDGGFKSVAMPLVATGDQRAPISTIMPALMEAALHWMSLGISLEVLRIFVPSERVGQQADAFFEAAKGKLARPPESRRDDEYDVFISYSHEDADDVLHMTNQLTEIAPDLRVFIDRDDLSTGEAWQSALFETIDRCRKLVAFLSPAYIRSRVCKDEFNIAWARAREVNDEIVFPVYLYSADLPTYMKMLQYADCREGARVKLTAAAQALIGLLNASR